uniref:Uncharacterized protein n=1 Tax=Lygus hesperus TaxID=30085 RepID=A0A0A9VZD5_LYGHE
MKNTAKGIQTEMGNPYAAAGTGYVTEKVYMLVQLYLQNKGWNQVELLQYLSEMKDGSMLPSAAYLQVMASRIALDNQGRLILRENGKIILPFEHFANAVMLKHMNGPHGLHLGLEATLRAVMDSYTIGRENFGMEKEFIVEVVNNCPNPACRYYKTQLDIHPQPPKPTYIPPPAPEPSSSHNTPIESPRSHAPPPGPAPTPEAEQSSKGTPVPPSNQQQHKLSDFLKTSIENLESLTGANKDLLAAHNGSWSSDANEVGQEKVVRAFSEIMKNMNRIKACVRPAMCKPYGKQSESLQKTIMDTIQLVQSLRSILPPPHIAVSSWKNEDKHRKMDDLCDNVRKVE